MGALMFPDFLVIGGQRCATGWIAQCLREHPEIYMAPDESRFFDRNYDNGLDWWRKTFFKNSDLKGKTGEKTANYLTDPLVPSRIYNTNPQIKLICCLRQPVDRMYSAFLMKARRDRTLHQLKLDELLGQEPDLLERGLYSKHLNNYFDYFPQDQVQVLLFEHQRCDPSGFIKDIYRFLDVKEDFIPGSLHIQTKPGRLENDNKLLLNLSRLAMSSKLPFRKLYSLLRPKSTALPLGWDSGTVASLQKFYKEEISELEVLLSLNLDIWRRNREL